MCGGGGGNQTVTTKTELDPALRRYLYGGSLDPQGNYVPRGSRSNVNPAAAATSMSGGGGGDSGEDYSTPYSPAGGGYTSFRDMFDGGGPGTAGTEFGGALGGVSNAVGLSPAEARFGDGIDRGGMYAMGGMVQPQQGIASLNQGQMPMVNGGLPNLSDPMVAATLAAAALRPQMQYGMPMGYAMGGYVEGPGTGTSDSIDAVIMQNGQPVQEALLSDGEFVMTERAVRGAGNGDREQGAARMYEMMRQFERGGRV
jgi:hypothetical protein